ncbi:hypothetical protein VTO42DRAFT_1366 [Malbranchea cinnamomea]
MDYVESVTCVFENLKSMRCNSGPIHAEHSGAMLAWTLVVKSKLQQHFQTGDGRESRNCTRVFPEKDGDPDCRSIQLTTESRRFETPHPSPQLF